MPSEPSIAQEQQQGNWDYLALSLNLFGLSILFIAVSIVIGILGTGSGLWDWLMDNQDATET
jgi:hypothetical protein